VAQYAPRLPQRKTEDEVVLIEHAAIVCEPAHFGGRNLVSLVGTQRGTDKELLANIQNIINGLFTPLLL
jgi:hypothetical protein